MSRFDLEQHLIVGHLATDHKSSAGDFGEALDDFSDLARMHKHAANLRGLIGSAHPTFDARIRAACGASA